MFTDDQKTKQVESSQQFLKHFEEQCLEESVLDSMVTVDGFIRGFSKEP